MKTFISFLLFCSVFSARAFDLGDPAFLAAMSKTGAVGGGDVTNGLVGWWKFNDGSGTTALDSSGNSHSGTLNGGASFGPGQNGTGGIVLDGTDDNVSVSGISWTTNEAKSVSIWFKTSTTGRTLVAQGQTIQLYVSAANGFQSWMSNDAWSVTCTGIADGNWHHLVYVYDGTQESLYFDGNSVGTPNVEGSLSTSATLTIGSGSGTEFINGTLDDVRIFNRALNSTEALQLFTNGAK